MAIHNLVDFLVMREDIKVSRLFLVLLLCSSISASESNPRGIPGQDWEDLRDVPFVETRPVTPEPEPMVTIEQLNNIQNYKEQHGMD